MLLVDDDVASLDEMGWVAQRCGLKVLSAKDGAEALKLICDYRPRLAVIDLHLPAINGARLSSLAAGLQPLLLLVLVSGDRALLAQEQASEPHVVARLGKPLDIARLEIIFRAAHSAVQGNCLAAP